jgi:hypothetical protein
MLVIISYYLKTFLEVIDDCNAITRLVAAPDGVNPERLFISVSEIS